MKDILSVITAYREERGWTEYQLAERSGLPQSTISSWYRKNMVPTIPSLEKICTAFDITMSQLFADGDAPGKPGWQNTTPVFPFCDGGDGRNGASEGLVHTAFNNEGENKSSFICNCCGCSCANLSWVNRYRTPDLSLIHIFGLVRWRRGN